MGDLRHVSVIIPALNEAEALSVLLPQMARMGLGEVLVCDNGSTDATPRIVRAHGATWVHEPQRGYGAACWAGIRRLAPTARVVVFLDADLSDDATLLPALAEPILRDEADFVVSSRVAALREPGAMTLPQRTANVLMPAMIRAGWGFRYTDLGPFRAIERGALDRIGMRDRAFGWTIEMQIRAVEEGLRIREYPVPYRCRRGTSKISGTIRGVFLATYWILRTCLVLRATRMRRLRQRT